MDKTGVIYILTNPSFPEYVKIGLHSALANGRICGANRPFCEAKQPNCRRETAE